MIYITAPESFIMRRDPAPLGGVLMIHITAPEIFIMRRDPAPLGGVLTIRITANPPPLMIF